MLKTRLVGVLVVKDGIVVQSIKFRRYLPVGNPSISVEYLNRWGIDEIAMLDIDATREGRRPKHEDIKEHSKHCQVPLLVGGGITDVSDIEKLVQSGADKVAINTAAVNNPDLVTEGARLFGNQCMVVSIDARRVGNGRYEVFTHSGTRPTGLSPTDLAKRAEDCGAGEILLNSIDRDGSKKGYDLELIRQVVQVIKIPLIVCGGVNHPNHLLEALELNVSAVAAANFFHYTEHSVLVAKAYVQAAGGNIRLDSYATYNGFTFDDDGRAAKITDSILEQLRFEYIPEEII